MLAFRPEALLFDLDGTLIDTAPDMLGALNRLRDEMGLRAIALSPLRKHVSRGALAILDAGLPELPVSARPSLKARYLELYVEFIACESKVFEGINSLLERLKREQMPWGIVTNKPQAMSQSLLAALKLSPDVLIGGDTLSVNKPHPEPVLAACRALGVAPNLAVMIGDDRRDIEAGRAAGCATVACAYGYVESAQEAASWGADVCLNESTALDALLA